MGDQSSYLSRISQIIFVEKNCHVEKFGLSIKNLNNLWSFIKIDAFFVPNLCGEKSAQRKSVWRKNDKYEVCALGMICDQGKTYSSSRDL